MAEKEYIERGVALDAITYNPIDPINRINRINPIEKPTDPDIIELTLLTAQKQIKKIPAADVVEVVRCRNCKNSPDIRTQTKGMRWCRRFRNEVHPNDFCSYGERKE